MSMPSATPAPPSTADAEEGPGTIGVVIMLAAAGVLLCGIVAGSWYYHSLPDLRRVGATKGNDNVTDGIGCSALTSVAHDEIVVRRCPEVDAKSLAQTRTKQDIHMENGSTVTPSMPSTEALRFDGSSSARGTTSPAGMCRHSATKSESTATLESKVRCHSAPRSESTTTLEASRVRRHSAPRSESIATLGASRLRRHSPRSAASLGADKTAVRLLPAETRVHSLSYLQQQRERPMRRPR